MYKVAKIVALWFIMEVEVSLESTEIIAVFVAVAKGGFFDS